MAAGASTSSLFAGILWGAGLVGCASLWPGLTGHSSRQAVKAPAVDRCAHWAEPLAQRGCARFRDRARDYLDRLQVGDAICLDPILQEETGAGCRARARIDDQDNHALRFILLDVARGSSWAPEANAHLWYETDALVDLYLKERGF